MWLCSHSGAGGKSEKVLIVTPHHSILSLLSMDLLFRAVTVSQSNNNPGFFYISRLTRGIQQNKICKTRVHSSRMRTARSLTVSRSIYRGACVACMTPCHAHPPPSTCMPPSTHITLCYACPPQCMPLLPRMSPTMHAPLPHMPPPPIHAPLWTNRHL